MSSTPSAVSGFLLAACLALAGSAHYVVNDPLPAVRSGPAYRFTEAETAQNTNSLFVCLIFSGGGTRGKPESRGGQEWPGGMRLSVVW